MKNWKEWTDECPKCGSESEIYTNAPDNYAYDNDNAQCRECGLSGYVRCDGDENDNGDTIAKVVWDGYEDEQ